MKSKIVLFHLLVGLLAVALCGCGKENAAAPVIPTTQPAYAPNALPPVAASTAVVHTCAGGMMGCVPTISVAGAAAVTLDSSSAQVQQMLTYYGNFIFPNSVTITLGNVQGTTTQSTGHMPNPTVLMTVYSLTAFTVVSAN